MLYPWRPRGRQVRVDFKVQFLRLGLFLCSCKDKAYDTWPTLTPR